MRKRMRKRKRKRRNAKHTQKKNKKKIKKIKNIKKRCVSFWGTFFPSVHIHEIFLKPTHIKKHVCHTLRYIPLNFDFA
jgi:hypothetical protein